ncbi:hypothetical protein AYO39_00995 [Actinobacteria bacterium SCGC AG-212-D09]|nr:hypothetical protein AYO39_00995 [Actinobacteria bacterium SCGC AG-212-D09]
MTSLIRALRYRTDEVQLGRALLAICEDDQQVAFEFVSQVLRLAAHDQGAPARRACRKLGTLSPPVRASGQARLFAQVGRRDLRGRLPLGIVDLDFRAPGTWRLLVELKIDAAFGEDQLRRYLESRTPLVAIIRSLPTGPTLNKLADPGARNWLGVITWEDLLPGLKALPIQNGRERANWRELLRVASQQDGDLSATRPPRGKAGRDARKALSDALPGIHKRLAATVVRKHGRVAGAALKEFVGPAEQQTWAGLEILIRPSRRWVWIELENANNRTPLLSVRWLAPRGASVRMKEAVAALERGGFEREHGDFVHETALQVKGEHELVPSVVDAVVKDLRTLVSAGTLNEELARLRKP